MTGTIKKIVLFSGSGLSAALGLPTVADFSDDLRSIAATKHVLSYLVKKNQANDIEHVLNTIESFLKTADFDHHLLHEELGPKHEVLKAINSFKKDYQDCNNTIKKLIFEKLDKFVADDAFQLFFSIIKEIKEFYRAGCSLSYFTTNYDLAFEEAIGINDNDWQDIGISNIDFGFTPDRARTLLYDRFKDYKWDENIIEFRKLHGSLDWRRKKDSTCVKTSHAGMPGNFDDVCLIYPGAKVFSELEPFASLHDRLYMRLKEADVIIIIGFTFRDFNINTIFENIIRNRRDIVFHYYNPMLKDNLINQSPTLALLCRYPTFKYHQEEVGNTPNPLGYKEKIRNDAIGA